MFEREHHRRIAALLEAIDAAFLLKHRCFFGGGTAIALSCGEYRESVDIDFMCASIDGYRGLREAVREKDPGWLFQRPVQLRREPLVDQYGIRMAVAVDEVPVKVELVFEARIAFKDPLPEDRICGVWRMAAEDLVASKLMANADRYADDAVMSRDLIDLAMFLPDGLVPAPGVEKARRAYGGAIDKAFTRARQGLLEREGRLQKCMKAMHMVVPEATLRTRIAALHLGA
ncbi:MAG: nucleotidyl transferase AbiEii/AbiGii toxin family protein [Hydrogenophaga sp.]|uniref:Nucleotidyl transferase AbiEii/AbiGii toxin family protein n=1 Tax=Hydrogenophaga crocea TaxID=2716225 RepID=A0A6G8IDC3_9BURK|nr:MULTISPECIES: nucleotidyl transferase AbiEii/AbiGii toxin family protein [Hydrogenophaga]MBL0942859.1 nucleotidyl transferase AbiEii/AbiGii toxin family protein [Hydrogenophaga sp.]QIM51152.1 nucleotidyl transferase AbiEii/AbiGii toxin family protein [Hydrogenophaga crocea]